MLSCTKIDLSGIRLPFFLFYLFGSFYLLFNRKEVQGRLLVIPHASDKNFLLCTQLLPDNFFELKLLFEQMFFYIYGNVVIPKAKIGTVE